MNKIYKVMYSKVKQCAVVVSEIAKSHGHNGESSGVRKHAALTAAVLIALGSLSFTTAFVPMTAEAADKTKTDGSNFVGVERTDGLFEDKDYANYKGQGAHGDDSITVGLKAIGGDGTITIGDRRAEKSLGSVYVGRGPGMPTGKVLPDKTDDGYWATSVGYQSDATGYGSIAIGSNAIANNSYDKDSNGHGIILKTTSGDGKTVVLNGKPDIQRASVAIGYGASADNGNIAIGSYSDASTDLRATTGDAAKAYLTEKTADSYVSVGKTGALRRISNVADGAADSDVATIRQLKALSDKAGVYNEGWGINIADEKDEKTGAVTKKNVISLNRNLGTNSGNTKAEENGKVFNGKVSFEAKGKNSLILGGEASTTYDTNVTAGTYGDYSVLVGGYNNSIKSEGKRAVVAAGSYNKASGENSAVIGGSYNQASGDNSVVIGGGEFSFDQGNQASGQFSTIIGGDGNKAQGINDVVSGGYRNVTSGDSSFIGGGQSNKALGYATAILGGAYNMGVDDTTVVGGQLNLALSMGVFAAGGSANQVAGLLSTSIGGQNQRVIGNFSTAIGGASTGIGAEHATAIGSHAVVTSPNGLALGFKATADKEGTISFGHDKGDISGYDSKIVYGNDGYYSGQVKSYLVPPASGEDVRSVVYTPTYYDSAEYNRLVKVDDGKDAHDTVVMEQLKPYTKSDASNIGANLKTYTVGEDGETITEADATSEKQKENKDNWGKALGAAPFTAGTTDAATNASTSEQLVTGKTLYDYDKPTGSQNYVNVNNTTGQNLSALDTQVKANADTLNDSTHNIKYYSVNGENLPGFGQADTFSNAGNKGAAGRGSLAAGAYTYTDGLASTVAGSYSGIYNKGTVSGTDFRGAAALSLGTVNINRNMDTTKPYSGVANSLIGQANVTTDSNAAIILGAGNTVKDSYRTISNLNLSGDMTAALKEAVPGSGGQVMVMGGGNSVDKAYMTQVTGVGNKVTGADSTYTEGTSTQYNFVDGFQNELTNGKHDYIIGSNNKVSGDSVDQNQSNIIFGDNHKLTNQKNNVIIGSSDTADDETTVSDIVAIGHNAKVSAEGGVAIGSGSEATVEGNKVAGYDPATGAASTNTASATWQATNGAVSIGTADGNVTRQINGVAAGTKETDAVNVAQLKTAQTSLTDKGLKFKGDDGNEVARKLSDTLTLKGGVTNTGDLSTAANIGVVKDGDSGLKIELAKNLTGLTSVTTGNTTIDNSGLTIKNATDATKNIVINSNNVSLGGNTITNMGSGLGNTYTGDGDNNSATIGDVKNLADARKTTVKSSDGTVTVTDKNAADAASHDYDLSVDYGKAASNLTLNYTGDNNTKGSNKLNESVAFNGTAGQIETKAENGKVTFKLSDDMTTKTVMVTGKDGKDGQIGLNGKDGKDGTVTTIIRTIGKNGTDGTDGKPGVDGKDGITRIVYQDGKDGESGTTTHTVATLDDGLKFKGDDNQEVTRKLDETLTLKGGVTNTGDLSTAANIGVVKDGDGGLKIELAKNLTGLTSVTTGNTIIDNSGLTIKNATDATKNIVINSNNVSLGGNTITNMGSGADASGNYTNTANAANVGDVQNIVKKAVDAASDATNQALAGKANVDASNLTPDNVTKWQEKLGNGKVESGNTGLVTGDTVFKAVDTKANRDGSNLTDKEADSFSEKIARGEVKAGENRAVSGDAVSQAISKVTGDMNTKLDGKANTSLDNITDTGKNVIRDLAKGSVKVIDGTNTTVTTVEGKGEKPTTYAVNVEGKGTVTSGNTGLISGGTAYTELRPADGSYVKQSNTTATNLTALDTQLKTTSDLIHTAGDTIQIGGSSTATKIDVSGKDANGNTTGRVITGVVTDAGDPTSAANVGYVNGVTAANTQQIYRDMNNAYGRLNNNINKAAAGSNALAALHPLDYDPDDKADFAVGYGHYRNANAAALGAFYHPNENTMVNVGVSLGNGDPGFNAGVSFKIGSGSAGHQAMSKTEMAKVINSQSKEIDALKKDNADKDKRIDALEQKMAEILAKLDKNGK